MVDLHRFDVYSVDLGRSREMAQEMAQKIPWGMASGMAWGNG